MSLPLTEAAKDFLDHCRIAKCLSAHTLRAYESDLGQFAAFPAPQIFLVQFWYTESA